MAAELNQLPDSIVAGETLTATITGLTTTGYTLTYSFASAVPFSVACTVSGSDFVLTLTPVQTIALRAGALRFAAMHAATGGATTCVDSGVIIVEASPLATSNYSAALAAVEAAILKFASNPNRRLSIDGMSIEYKTLDELLSLRSFYRSEINKDLGQRGGGPQRVLARFAW